MLAQIGKQSSHLGAAAEDALTLLRRGAAARRIGETRMNKESSRSHSVFACTLESAQRSAESGVTAVRVSRLHLIDLAGPAYRLL